MRMWGVIRDDELIEAYRFKYQARSAVAKYRPGSKHKWKIAKVAIASWSIWD